MLFYKNCEVLENTIFKNTAARLLLISWNIFNEPCCISEKLVQS